MPSPLIELTASIVAAHAAISTLTQEDLLAEIRSVHAALASLETDTNTAAPAPEKAPPVPVKQSIQKQQVICLLCGKDGFKTLTRHLKQVHGIQPAAYRKQFGLPAGTPLVDKADAATRRQAALSNNLAANLAKDRAAKQQPPAAAPRKKTTTKKTAK